MMNEVNVVAGIVTYNPNLKRLKENIESIIGQVQKVCLVDNGSYNTEEIELLKKQYPLEIILNFENKGIAAALNQIMLFAKRIDARWCVTLDQDSIVPPNLLQEAEPLLIRKDIGQIVPVIYEEQSGEYCYLDDTDNREKLQEVSKSITSSSINSVSAWEECGKFDEMLFIDYVDYDFCMKLRCAGYKIYRLNRAILEHQIGDSYMIKIFGKKVRVGNHNAFRKYYIGRNMVIYIHRYKKRIDRKKEYLRLIKVMLLLLFCEEDKRNRFHSFCKGINDGIRYNRMGKAE